MKNKIFINILVLVMFFVAPIFVFAQDIKDINSASSSFSKIIDTIDNFRKKTADKFEEQKKIFDEKSNIGEVSQDVDLESDEATTNYVVKGSSDKLIEPIYKVLSFLFYGLWLIFTKATLFYIVLFFFFFILLRYLWRRAV